MTDDIQPIDPVEDPLAPEPKLVRADERLAINPMVQRFLFVDVAAQRAKQLRKGALNRIVLAIASGDTQLREVGLKPERVAMEEVRRGFIEYELPDGTPLKAPQEG